MPKRDDSRVLLALPCLLSIGFALAARPSCGQAAGRLVPRASGGSNVEWAARRGAAGRRRQARRRELPGRLHGVPRRRRTSLEDRLQSLGLDSGSYRDPGVTARNRLVVDPDDRGAVPPDQVLPRLELDLASAPDEAVENARSVCLRLRASRVGSGLRAEGVAEPRACE
jgi:hypothetical protein